MYITFLQTADPYGYKPMLDTTSRTVIEYCRRHDFAYESYVGIKRGYFPWHATFNRMFMLVELVDRGFRGWAIYLDADAYVHDLDFDLAGWLTPLADRAAIMTSIPGAPFPWCINAGVLAFNLGHDKGIEIVRRWRDRFLQINDDRLRDMEIWDDGDSDQSMLFELLDRDASLRAAVHFDDGAILNSPGAAFIRQLLRSLSSSLDARVQALAVATAVALGPDRTFATNLPGTIAASLYRGILGREPDAGGLAGYAGHIDHVGMEEGIRHVASELVRSEEFRRKYSGNP